VCKTKFLEIGEFGLLIVLVGVGLNDVISLCCLVLNFGVGLLQVVVILFTCKFSCIFCVFVFVV